jgi:hypothetical protein
MTERHFPVRPNLEQLKHQAKDLLRADPALGKLALAQRALAQRALAQRYGLPSWPRLVLACRMTDAIWPHGADVNGRAVVDADGFGGHTALFGCVVSQPYRVGLRTDDAFARLLLDHGADPNVRASLRKRLRYVPDETMHEYPDVTPVAWGEQFHDRDWVSPSALRLIAERREARA